MRSGDIVTDIVVVITLPGMSGVDNVRTVLEGWTAAGFVRPFLWWVGDNGGRQLAVWSDNPSAEPGSLLDALADKPYDRIRLVSLLPLTTGDVEPDLPERAELVRRAVAERLAPGQRLSTVGVLVPASGVADVPCTVLSTLWDVNLVVVDEDGVDPRHASREVGPDTIAGHTALALVTVSGLWTGITGGPFDDDRDGAGDQEPHVRLIRCFARAVRSHGLTDEIAQTTVRRWQDSDWAAELAGAHPVEDSEPWVEQAADDYLTGQGARLRRTPYRPIPWLKYRITPRQAWQALKLFMLGRIGEIQQTVKNSARDELLDRIETFTERVVFGDGTDFVVRFDGRPIGEPRGQAPGESVDLAQALMTAIERPAVQPTFSDEWRALRDLSFGLVDAGDLPKGCEAPMSGVHRLVVDVPAVSPPPEPGQSLPEWLAAAPSSLVARIGGRLLSDTEAARDAFMEALERLKRSKPRLSAPVFDRRLWYVWLAICGVSVLGGVTAGVLGGGEAISLRSMVEFMLLCLTVVVLGTAVVGFLQLRKEFQAAHKANLVWTAFENARGAAEHEAGELVRLAAASAEYQDWVSIVAAVLHTAAGTEHESPPDPVDLRALVRPSAFGVAAAETNPRLLDRLAAIIGKRCFRQGWLSGLYSRTEDVVMTEVKFDRGLPETTANPDPVTDSRARRELTGQLRDGLTERLLLDDILRIATEQMADLGPHELFSAVQPPTGTPMPATEFMVALLPASDGGAPFNRRLWSVESGFREDVAEPLTQQSGLTRQGTAITMQTVRVDATAAAMWYELALFREREESPLAVPVFEDGVG